MKSIIAALLLVLCFSGCQSFLHELKPHRLSRLNYTDAHERSDGSFLSIDDPLDVPIATTYADGASSQAFSQRPGFLAE